MACKSGVLTQDGGNSSSTILDQEHLLASEITLESLILLLKILRDNLSEFRKPMVESTKDGVFSILTRRIRQRQKD
jgi:hypothetical protein